MIKHRCASIQRFRPLGYKISSCLKFDSFATAVNSTTVAKLSILYYKEKHIVTKLISQPPRTDYPLLPRAALRWRFLLPRGKFFLSPLYFSLSAKIFFITNFVIYVTNFLTRVTNFVIHVTNFVTNSFL